MEGDCLRVRPIPEPQRYFQQLPLIAFLLTTILMSSCTVMESRTYVVEPVPGRGLPKAGRIFVALRQYLALLGYEPAGPEALSNAQYASFRFNGPQRESTVWGRAEVKDLVNLYYQGESTFSVQFERFHHGSQGITREEESAFVEKMARYILESANTSVSFYLVGTDG